VTTTDTTASELTSLLSEKRHLLEQIRERLALTRAELAAARANEAPFTEALAMQGAAVQRELAATMPPPEPGVVAQAPIAMMLGDSRWRLNNARAADALDCYRHLEDQVAAARAGLGQLLTKIATGEAAERQTAAAIVELDQLEAAHQRQAAAPPAPPTVASLRRRILGPRF
jgi:hypothetical protein